MLSLRPDVCATCPGDRSVEHRQCLGVLGQSPPPSRSGVCYQSSLAGRPSDSQPSAIMRPVQWDQRGQPSFMPVG
jgi:hypothetical protein